MTPDINAFKAEDSNQHIHRTQEQRPVEEHNFKSIKNNSIFGQDDNKSNLSNRYNHNLGSLSGVAAQGNKANIVSLESSRGVVNPVAGGFSSYQPVRKWF